jgi:acyl-CoA reductase-like NAD-dependent aldehyde dehydrogenase
MNAVASPRSRSDWERLVAPLRPEGRALINGKLAAARSGQVFEKKSPIDGRVIAQVARCGSEDVEAAVAAARASFEAGHWRHAEPRERKRVLLRFAELIRTDLERLAMLETLDVGKPIQNSLDVDVPKAIECIAYYGEYADKLYDEIAPTGPNDLALIRREPLGVIAAIVPWNYPLIVTSWKLGPALLVGNSVVLKPAEQSPLSAIRLGELALEAGVPPGVLNVVPGFGEEAGKPLALHPDVDMVSFTGSTEVGKLMLRYAGESNLKRVSLECGGKSPHVVLADADLDVAAEAIAWGIYYNAGETCNAGSRLIVHERVREPLLEAIRRVAAGITLGNPFDPATRMGALIDEGHMRRVLGYIDGGVADGARLALGGKRALAETGGYYVQATILDAVRPGMRVAREEIFGPVLAVTSFGTEDEALTMANDSIYGLAAAVWTHDINAAHRHCAPGRCGSTASTVPHSPRPSAASNSQASGATARRTPSRSTPI